MSFLLLLYLILKRGRHNCFIKQVNVNLKVPGKKLEHHGIKIEFVGQIGEKIVFFAILHCRLIL